MMRFTGALGGVFAAIVIVPAAGFGQHGADEAVNSLEAGLRKTVETLELLSGIRQNIETEGAISTSVAVSVTEAPIPGAQERDEKLDLLRTQVSLLQQELDVVESRILQASQTEKAPDVAPLPPRLVRDDRFTLGLETGELDTLRALDRPRVIESVVEEPSEPPVEFEGYSANTLLQAQMCYRARQYSRGLKLLANDESPGGLYWRARCLERLERLAEAITFYERVAGMTDAGSFAERAETNLEFVRWKQGLEAGGVLPATGSDTDATTNEGENE